LLDIIAKNATQKNPAFPINNGIHRTVIQPTIWYTCPVGKKAFVKGTVRCTSRGAAANVDLDLAGITDVRWTGAIFDIRFNYDQNNRRNVPVANGQVKMTFQVDLVAGQTVETNQSSGTNAEINMWATVLESEV